MASTCRMTLSAVGFLVIALCHVVVSEPEAYDYSGIDRRSAEPASAEIVSGEDYGYSDGAEFSPLGRRSAESESEEDIDDLIDRGRRSYGGQEVQHAAKVTKVSVHQVPPAYKQQPAEPLHIEPRICSGAGPRQDVLFSHPERCDKYIQCVHGLPMVRDCGPGTFWIPNKNYCGAWKDSFCANVMRLVAPTTTCRCNDFVLPLVPGPISPPVSPPKSIIQPPVIPAPRPVPPPVVQPVPLPGIIPAPRPVSPPVVQPVPVPVAPAPRPVWPPVVQPVPVPVAPAPRPVSPPVVQPVPLPGVIPAPRPVSPPVVKPVPVPVAPAPRPVSPPVVQPVPIPGVIQAPRPVSPPIVQPVPLPVVPAPRPVSPPVVQPVIPPSRPVSPPIAPLPPAWPLPPSPPVLRPVSPPVQPVQPVQPVLHPRPVPGLTVQVPHINPAICQEAGARLDVIFAHPDRCDQYIQCVHGLPRVRSCGPDTYFDPKAKNCGFWKTSYCANNMQIPVPTQTCTCNDYKLHHHGGKGHHSKYRREPEIYFY